MGHAVEHHLTLSLCCSDLAATSTVQQLRTTWGVGPITSAQLDLLKTEAGKGHELASLFLGKAYLVMRV